MNDDASSHTLAKRAAQALGPIPTSFTTVVRMLSADYREGFETFSKKSEFEVNRILKVSTVVAMLYHACGAYYQKRVDDIDLRPIDLARLLDPLSLAAVFSLSYLYKRCQRITPPEEWKRLSAAIGKWVDIGGLLGTEVEAMTLGPGILGGSVPLLGNVPFIIHDAKGFATLRRKLGGLKPLGDSAVEQELFGCTCIEIGASMIQLMGFGPDIADVFHRGLSRMPAKNEDELYGRFKNFSLWTKALETEVRQPNLREPRELIAPARAPIVLGRISDLMLQTVESKWLDKTRDDIGAEKTPLLHF